MAVPALLFGWLATYASAYSAASFQARGEDKDLASVVWETALAAFQAVAAEPPRASPAEFVESLNRTLKIGTGMAPVSKKFLDRKIAARFARTLPATSCTQMIPDYCYFPRGSAFRATGPLPTRGALVTAN
jgi:hypothetical protein